MQHTPGSQYWVTRTSGRTAELVAGMPNLPLPPHPPGLLHPSVHLYNTYPHPATNAFGPPGHISWANTNTAANTTTHDLLDTLRNASLRPYCIIYSTIENNIQTFIAHLQDRNEWVKVPAENVHRLAERPQPPQPRPAPPDHIGTVTQPVTPIRPLGRQLATPATTHHGTPGPSPMWPAPSLWGTPYAARTPAQPIDHPLLPPRTPRRSPYLFELDNHHAEASNYRQELLFSPPEPKLQVPLLETNLKRKHNRATHELSGIDVNTLALADDDDTNLFMMPRLEPRAADPPAPLVPPRSPFRSSVLSPIYNAPKVQIPFDTCILERGEKKFDWAHGSVYAASRLMCSINATLRRHISNHLVYVVNSPNIKIDDIPWLDDVPSGVLNFDERTIDVIDKIMSIGDDKLKDSEKGLAPIKWVTQIGGELFFTMHEYDCTLQKYLDDGHKIKKETYDKFRKRVGVAIDEMHCMFCYHGNINSHSVLVKTYTSNKPGVATSKTRLYLGNYVGVSMRSQDNEALRVKDLEDYETLLESIYKRVL